MNVLIGCESSGIVRDAFNALGWNAWSCDLKPSEGRAGNHLQGDVRWAVEGSLHRFPDAVDIRTGHSPVFRKWDLAIFHPECTRLCNSGVRWLAERDLWREMEQAAATFNMMRSAPIPHKACENPIPHKYARELIGDYDQLVQPWQFGHREMKATCFWLDNLPLLVETDVVGPPPADPVERRKWAKVHQAPPGPNRSTDRARTLPGIAAAMAAQWGRAAFLNYQTTQ